MGGMMSRTLAFRLLVLGGVICVLASCENAKRQLGLGRDPPDEFQVLSRAPLSLPPDFNLRPPQPGAPRPQEGTASQQARQAVFRNIGNDRPAFDQIASDDGRSPGERELLDMAGADNATPGIRQIVDAETQQINEESDSFIEELVFWRKRPPPGQIVDAEAEERRLRENAALGREVTDGPTPTIVRKEKALLEGLF